VDRIGSAALSLTGQGAANEAAPSGSEEKLAQRIRRGLRAGEFGVAFQPVVHAQSLKLLNVECLLRWQHPEYGLLLPECFASAFEDRDTAREVSEFMLESVCLQLGEMQRTGQALPAAAINIQPSQLLDATLGSTVRAATLRHGLDPTLLELELVATVHAGIHALVAATRRAPRAQRLWFGLFAARHAGNGTDRYGQTGPWVSDPRAGVAA
jgi:EAL domain-containing protein (putative c-di-GMP-specific phosphodiesterase class I)